VSQPERATVIVDGKLGKNAGLVLVPGLNLRCGDKDLEAVFGNLTSLENDLLRVASAIFACDLAFKRGERENITRNIDLTIPVVNSQAFQRLREDLETILYVLSHDNWTITFKRMNGTPEPALEWPERKGTTLLFSGGLDSLAAAVDLLDDFGPDHVQLASHVTGNQVTRHAQEAIVAYLNTTFETTVERVTVRTGGHKHARFDFPSDQAREETQRTRSFMYLTIAALAARRRGHSEVVMIAENGQMAIHLPLSAARIGAFSTHTAHPQFVKMAGDVFSTVLDYKIEVSNPYVYLTKAEVIRTIATKHKAALAAAVSCWRGSRVTRYNHCGECVPCLIRRIALEANGVRIAEYSRDLLAQDLSTLSSEDEGKRNVVELAEFAVAFKTLSATELQWSYPDLFNAYFDMDSAVQMYKRFADEALRVLTAYPSVRAILPPLRGLGVAKRRSGAAKEAGRPK
jgi:7-cyano-7-deazaguanine synthase in queuosine biosynthesis